MEAPKLAHGQNVMVHSHWDGKTKQCVVLTTPYKQDDEILIGIKFENGDDWTARWIDGRWETSEY